MLDFDIRQTGTPGHPGVFTEEELRELIDELPPSIQTPKSRLRDGQQSKHKAIGDLLIAITFISGGVASSILSEIGKDIYDWVKKKLLERMKAKQAITRARNHPDDYDFNDPCFLST